MRQGNFTTECLSVLIIDDEKIMDLQKAEKKLFELETIPGSLIECIAEGDKFVAHARQLVSGQRNRMMSWDHLCIHYLR